MFWLILAGFVGLLAGVFLLKFLFVKVAVQALLAYNAIIGRNIQAKYQLVDVVPDWVKTFADNNIYQRYSIDPLRVVAYPAFYRNGFKFFNRDHYQYAIFYDGTGKYTVYRKLIHKTPGNKTKSIIEEKSKIKV